ncbi:hypothetical protein DWB64_05520 [Fusibacter sp. A1]|nr:hypothetical protein DWB64_05520 [Fusibacter sp. A1]
MRETLYTEAVELVKNRQYQQAVDSIKEILEAELQDDVHYKALKLYADLIGPIANKDYIAAIDMYQSIINETENDDLYAQSQIAILNAYLSLSIDMMDAYESTRDVIETDDDSANDFMQQLDQRREDFLTARAEAVYKKRM